ncbi:MAG: ACP S-malonyltransferase [Acidobacteria bacterium]|jgi:[acyl-carrier-protein] S-malonyltransferase|nr:ACP S-malonyltransferase [Acidobacteriota bacterium]MBA4123319.1 ACP S-malonyltransferase [Acidobacteriota bacterium]
MSKTAFIFPGQGSQAVGMGKDLFDNFSISREVFEEADDALGFSLSEMCFSGTAEDLALTSNTQPAILTVSVAAFRAMVSEGFPIPDFVAGHSLGEYSALVAAGAVNFTDAVKTVRKRGTYMQNAVPFGVGAMAAILGLPLETVEITCEEAKQGQVCNAANINSPSQVVIAGNTEAIDRAIEILKERGAKRAIKLNVSAPFHCALMLPAQEKLAADLQEIDFKDLTVPIIENFSAESNVKGERVRTALTEQVSKPVRWAQSVENLIVEEVKTFVEVGAGRVLSGLVKQINRDVRILNVENSTSLKEALNNL